MAEIHPDQHEVDARILYWGIEGSGKTSNLQAIHGRLRRDHRGEMQHVPTPLDPTVTYEVLPIKLGEIGGVRTRIQAIAVPGSPEHAPTRKALLDRTAGVVFVIDARREQIDANLASFDELRGALAAYGRALEGVPLVLQYNKRDVSDPYALEELHRKLDLHGVTAFEAVAREGTGVIQTLTTISKRVIRALRETEAMQPTSPTPEPTEHERPQAEAPEPAADSAQARLEAEPDHIGEAAQAPRLPEAMREPAREWDPEPSSQEAPVLAGHGWRLLDAGQARVVDARTLEIPLVLADAEGHETRLHLRLALDPDLEEAEG